MEMTGNKKFIERRDEVYLCKCIFGDDCRKEFAEMDKHEIVAKICDILGAKPENFSMAEEIFDAIRFEAARYVIHHEYSKEEGIKPNLLLWLDSRYNPDMARGLASFFMKYV